MAKRPSLEDRLVALREAASDPHGAGAMAALRDALRSKTGVLVAAAAGAAAAHGVEALIAELPAAYERLLERAVERDPGCRGKAAVVRALHDLDRWDDVFAHALGYVQLEPVWGGRVDTAAEVRAIAGYAYAHAGRSDALDALAGLLADPERSVRAAAARAIGDTGRTDATALLRFKVLTGDDEPEVLTACHGSLLALAAEASLRFAAAELDRGGDRAAAAALGLGESRLEAAVPVLTGWCDRDGGDVRAGFVALAVLRREPATAYLLDVVRRDDRLPRVRAAIEALATFRDDQAVVARVLDAAEASGDAAIRRFAREQLRVS